MWLAMKASLQEKCYWILKDSSPLQKYSCPMKFIYSCLYYLCYWSKTLHIWLCTTASLSHLTMWHDKYQSWTNHRKNCSQWDRHTKVLNSQVPGTNKICFLLYSRKTELFIYKIWYRVCFIFHHISFKHLLYTND